MFDGQVTKEVRTLSILFSIYGWVSTAFSLLILGYFAVVLGGAFLSVPKNELQPGEVRIPEPDILRLDPSVLLLLFFVVAMLSPIIYIVIGACLKRGRAKWLAYVGAILALWNVPLGLALGIYTFVVLGKTENQQGFV